MRACRWYKCRISAATKNRLSSERDKQSAERVIKTTHEDGHERTSRYGPKGARHVAASRETSIPAIPGFTMKTPGNRISSGLRREAPVHYVKDSP